MTKPSWYIGDIYICPTNFSSPQRIAIEATDKEHAEQRLYKLYNDGYDRASVRFTKAEDSDDLYGARQHKLPTALT